MKIFYFSNYNSFINNCLNNLLSYIIINLIFILLSPRIALSNPDICNIIRRSRNSNKQSLLKLQAVLEQKIDLNQLDCNPNGSLLNFAYESPGDSFFISDIRQGRYDAVVQLLNHVSYQFEKGYISFNKFNKFFCTFTCFC